MATTPPLTDLPAEESDFRRLVRQFAEEEIRPLVQRMDAEAQIPRALIDGLFSRGLMGIEIPAEYRGRGGSFFLVVLAIEELARVDPSVAVLLHVHNALVANALMSHGSPEQRQRCLTRLARDTVGAFAISEEEAGSDAFALATEAVLDGGTWILNGRKKWATNGAEAGLFLVFAKTAPEQGAAGITGFLLERDLPGFRVGRREEKLGIRASSTCELVLEDVRLPAGAVVGKVGAGSSLSGQTLAEGRIGIAAQMLGLAQGAFEAAADYAQERRQFGQPIASFQGIHFPLAEMATEIEAARLLVYNAARLRETQRNSLRLFRAASMAKLFASRVAERAASQAVEICGGKGFTRDLPVEKLYRDAKVGAIYEGTSNMQLRTIAKTLLRVLQ
jgi:alkylation response protein AidB-like acyl-CoA dehydrogenase